MGELNVGSGGSTTVIGPPPPPPNEEEVKKKQADAQPKPAAPPVKLPDLKKLTSEVKSLGIKLSSDFLDKNGNIREDKAAEAKKAIAEEAAKRKAKDPGAAARLYQKALSLDPQDKSLRIETAKTWKTWADSQPKPEVKVATLQTALETLKPVGDAEQSALFIDYSKEFAGLSVQAKQGKEGRIQMAKAALVASEEQLDSIQAFLAKPENSDLLMENEHPWMFLGDTLASVGKFGEACFAYNRGVNAAQKEKNFSLRDDFNSKWSLAHEEKYPYAVDFVDPTSGEAANPLANGLYNALKAKGISSSAMDKEVEGKSDRTISANEVYSYISDHIDDPEVKAVLAQSQLFLSEDDKKQVKEKGFSKFMADRFAHEAKKIDEERRKEPGWQTSEKSEQMGQLLLFAHYFEPQNPDRFEELGWYFSSIDQPAAAMDAFASAVELDPNHQAKTNADVVHDNFMRESLEKLKKGEAGGLPEQEALLRQMMASSQAFEKIYPDRAVGHEHLKELGNITVNLGKVLNAQGKREQGKAFLEKASASYMAAIMANPNDAKFCYGAYLLRGDAAHEMGDHFEANRNYMLAAQCQKLAIKFDPKDQDAQVPDFDRVRFQRTPIKSHTPGGGYHLPVISGKDVPYGNYIHSDVHAIADADGKNILPSGLNFSGGSTLAVGEELKAYDQKLEGILKANQEKRAALESQPETSDKKLSQEEKKALEGKKIADRQAALEIYEEDAKILHFLGRTDEAKKMGEAALELREQVSLDKAEARLVSAENAGLLSAEGLKQVTDRENKNQPPLEFSQFVKFEKPIGTSGGSSIQFTPEYDKLSKPDKLRVLNALIASAERQVIGQQVKASSGPAKIFFEAELMNFDGDTAKAKEKYQEYLKQAGDPADGKGQAMVAKAKATLDSYATGEDRTEAGTLKDVRALLAPMMMTLKTGNDGGIDLSSVSKESIKSFEDFRDYLSAQTAVDGLSFSQNPFPNLDLSIKSKNFNFVLFTNYQKVLSNPKHEKLLRLLYKEFDPEGGKNAPAVDQKELQGLYMEFQKDMIRASESRFVSNHLSTKEGRSRLRAILAPKDAEGNPVANTMDPGVRADLLEEIVGQGHDQGYCRDSDYRNFQKYLSTWGIDFSPSDQDIANATRIGLRVLDGADQIDKDHSSHVEKYLKFPHEIQRLHAGNLDAAITPDHIKGIAQMVEDSRVKTGGVEQMKAKLGTFWLLVVDNENWKAENNNYTHVPEEKRAEIANKIQEFLKEAEGIKSDADFVKWNHRIGDYLRGHSYGLTQDSGTIGDVLSYVPAVTIADEAVKMGKSLVDGVGDKVGIHTVAGSFGNMRPGLAQPFHDLLKFSDEFEAAQKNGVEVSALDPDVAIQDEKAKEKARQGIQDLRGWQRNFYYQYEQRCLITRNPVGSGGDLAKIKAANKEIDGIISDIQKAKTPEELKAVEKRLTEATKEGGAIHKGFVAAEMDGTQQIAMVAQILAEMVLIEVATGGMGSGAAISRGMVEGAAMLRRTRSMSQAIRAFRVGRIAGEEAAHATRIAKALGFKNAAELGGYIPTAAEIANVTRFGSGAANLTAQQMKVLRGLESGEYTLLSNGTVVMEKTKDGAYKIMREGAETVVKGQEAKDIARMARAEKSTKTLSAGSRTVGETDLFVKGVKGFNRGFTMSMTDSIVEDLSGKLKTQPETVLDWLINATATGVSMSFTGALHSAHPQELQKGILEAAKFRWLAQGPKGAMTFLGDAGMEVVEEMIDNYVNKFLHGDYTAMSWDEFRDITIVCFAGGVKQGMWARMVKLPKHYSALKAEQATEGFKNRKESLAFDQKLGNVVLDADNSFVRKADENTLHAYLAYESNLAASERKGIPIVHLESATKGAKAESISAGLEEFAMVASLLPTDEKVVKEVKGKQVEETRIKSVEKVQNDRTKKLFLGFLEQGQEVHEVKGKDSAVLVDAQGTKLRDATKDELETFQTYQKLTEGFATRGEKIVGSPSKGYQLVDAKGQTLRQATGAELTLYLKHKKKTALDAKAATEPLSDAEANSPAHKKAVERLVGEMKADLEQGAQVRLKTKPVDKIEISNANDPQSTAHEGPDGKVGYYVKVKADGSRERASQAEIEKFKSGKIDAPIVLGVEMVDKDGKVIRENLTRNHLVAFEAWKTQVKEAPVHEAMKQAGIKATDEAGKKLQANLLHGVDEGKIGKEDLKKASGEGLSKERIAELEGQLGMPRSEWLGALAKDPAAFKARIKTIETTRTAAESVLGLLQSGRNRAQVKAAVVADLKKAGVEISTNTEKAVDSMIDLTLTAQKNGLINSPGGLTANQLAGLMATLYLHQSPSVRIGGAEITHVPMVVEGTLSLLLTDNPKATVSDKRVAFVTALFHDAGKWDPEMRTESGFTVKQHPFFNPTGMDLEIKSGETLNEGLDRMVQEGTLSQEARDKVKIPGFLVSVIAHHDSSNVHDAVFNLEKQGILKPGEATKAWQAIERHGLISSWILNNSTGGIGVMSHVFNKPEFGRYVELYQKVTGRMLKGEQVDLGVLTTDKDVRELRGIFSRKFTPLDRAMLLGDHQGQIDVAKYLDILSTVYQNPVTDPNVAGGKGEVIVTPESAKVGDVFFARDPRIKMTHGVDGVLTTHANEQSLVDPTQGIFASTPFENAQGWLNGEGLVQAINPKESRDKATGVQKEFRDWAAKNKKNEDSPEALREWMGTLPLFKQSVGVDGKPVLEKNAQGKPVLDSRFAEIREKVEKSFYQWHALNEAKPLEIKQAHEDAKPAAAAPAKQTPAQAKAAKEAMVAQWRGAFKQGVTVEPVYGKGNVRLGYRVQGVTAETAGLFMKDKGEFWASKDQVAAYQKYRVDVKVKEEAKAAVIEMGAKMDANKPANDNDSPAIRMAARATAVDVLFDPTAPLSKDKLSKNVESIVSVVEALDPVLKQLAPVEKSQFQEQIIRQIQDGSLDLNTAKKMAQQVAQGANPRDVLMGEVPQSVSSISLVDEVSGERTPVESRPPPPPVKGEKLQPKALLEFTSDREVTASTKEALQKWLTQAPDAPKTQAEIDALLVDLRKGAEHQADGKLLVISDGYVHVETIGKVKERMAWAMKTFSALKAEGKPLPDFAKRAILERALRQAGKGEADIDSDVRYVVEQGEKLAGEVKGLPKPIAKNLTERYMRGDINLYSARQSAKKYSEVSAHAKELGIQDFDQRMQTRIETWYPDAKTNPSVAMEKSLASYESILYLMEPLLDGMDPATKKSTLDKIVDGNMTLDLAHDQVVTMTLGAVLDNLPPKEAEATVRQFLKTVLGSRYTTATEGTYNNYFKAYGAKKVMADAMSAMGFDYKIPTVEFVKLAQSLEGLDTKSQMALLANLMAQVKQVDGNATTDIDPSSMMAARIGVLSMVSDTAQLAKQLKDLDADGQAKLLRELGEGKYTLPGAIMQADRIGTAAKRGDKSSDPDKTFVSGSQMGPTPPVGLDPDATNPGVPAAKLKAKEEISAADPDATNPGVPAAKLKAKQSPEVKPGDSQALSKEAEFLAATDTPFAKAAKDLTEGRITPDQYRAAQRAEAQKMIDANKPAFKDVMGFLQSLEQDPSLHLDKGHPPMGRMKAADDVAPKLVRRGWNSMNPLTDVAGARIVVGSNADVEAVISQLQQKYKIREVYSKDGDMEMDVMTPDQMKAQGIDEQEHNVVWLDSQLDKDGIHRLVEGHPASGYRALHVVVEVDGQPVEIQIKTAAMHEWGEIEHKLVYKNKDLPEAVMAPIKEYRKNVADYLAKLSHGEDPGKRPEPPSIPPSTPNRADILANLAKMEGLMDKYGEPSGVKAKAPSSDPDATKPGVVHPMPSAALPADPHVEAASALADPGHSGVRSLLEGAAGDKAKIAEIIKPFEAVAKAIEGEHKESAEKLRQDLATLQSADPKSKEYHEALTRLHALQTLIRAEGTIELNAAKLAKAAEESRSTPTIDSESPATRRAPTGYPAGLGLFAGAIALFSPELAHAAEGAAQDISSRGGVGPTEAALIVGIGLLIGGPTLLKKYWKKGPPPAPKVTKSNPLKLESETRKGVLYPYSKADMKNAEMAWPGQFSQEDSVVIGDRVYLALDTKLPGEKISRSVLPMSVEDAKRLGVEFDKQGHIAKVPAGEFIYFEGAAKTPGEDFAVAAKAMEVPIAPSTDPVSAKDSDGNVSHLRPLSVTESGEGAPSAMSYGKAVSVEVGKGEGDPVKVTVEIYDPADPEADPKVLGFGFGNPKALEARSFEVSRAEAIQLGILRVDKPGEAPVIAENAVLVLNDEAANLHRNNRVYIPTSNEGGLTFYPAKAMGKNERLVGDIVKVDTELTSRQGDTVYVWLRVPDVASGGAKGKLFQPEPIPMSLADARKLGIHLGHDGKLKIQSNEFVATGVTKGGSDQVLVGGKPFAGEEEGGVSVMFRIGKDGQIEMETKEKPVRPKAEILPPPSISPEGKKIPDALKVAGPLAVGFLAMFPDTAHAATQISDAAATGGWMAAVGAGLSLLVGMAWWKSGSSGGAANHPPMVPSPGMTRFEFYVGKDGKPTIIPGLGLEPAMTFQRGPGGQWFAHEGRSPDNTAQGVQGNWKPIQDGSLVKLFNPHTGEAYVIPFQAPQEAWIPGYAPPAATDGPPQQAVSGPLPTGKLTAIQPFVDDRPFVIGRGQGDLQYNDTTVSNPHVTIHRDIESGQYYLVNGKLGDPKKSTNGILVSGVLMQEKVIPLQNGQYFGLKGSDGKTAYFQFVDPQIPAGRVSSAGYVVLGGESFKLSKQGPANQGMIGSNYFSEVTFGSPIPGDPAGSITLAVSTRLGFDPSRPATTQAIIVTAEQARQLGISLGPDGRPLRPMHLQLTPGVETQVAPLAAGEPAKKVVAPPSAAPPSPAPHLKVVPKTVDVQFGRQSFGLEPHPKSQALQPGTELGNFTRLTPHVQPGVFVAEISYGLPGQAPKKMVVNLSVDQLNSLGVGFDAQGRPLQPKNWLRVRPGEVQPVQPAVKPADMSGVQMVVGDNSPGAPRRGEVRIDKATEVYGTAAGQTHEGIGYKEKNEDAVVQGPNWALVLDGMGGHEGGAEASKIAGEAIGKFIQENQGKLPPEKLLEQALLEGNKAVQASDVYRKASDKKKPGAVGVLHLVVKNPDGTHALYLAHVGDAGAIVVGKDGQIKHRSADQSLLHDFYKNVMSGEYDEQMVRVMIEHYPHLGPFYEKIQKFGKDSERMEMEIRSHPYANIVSGGLGSSGVKPIVQKFDLEPGDRVVMFSDGVGDANSTADVAKIAVEAKSAKDAADKIMNGTMEKMADFEDAIAELPKGKRLPITRLDGNIGYVDRKGNIYESLTPEPGEKAIDHYKADNVTVHVYEHNPTGGKTPGSPPPSGAKLKAVPNPPPLPAKGKTQPMPPIPVKVQADGVIREGAPAGILMGGNSIAGDGELIPRDGKIVDFSGTPVRYNPSAARYEFQNLQTEEWQALQPGQQLHKEQDVFIFAELQGVAADKGVDKTADLLGQVKSQMASGGVQAHLAVLSSRGERIDNVDRKNMEIFFTPNFEAACLGHDGGNPIRRAGGLLGGHSEVFAMVDPATGAIHRFLTRSPKEGESGKRPLWTAVKNPSGQLLWVNRENPSQQEPVDMRGVPPGAIPVPFVLDRMSGKLNLDVGALPQSGLSPQAQAKMSHLNGFVAALPTAGIAPLMRYQDQAAAGKAPAVVFSKV